MANTRTVKSPGVFANAALTVIPPSPVAGVAYRNASVTAGEVNAGWPFTIEVDSATYNEIMFRVSSLIDILDKSGMLGWTNLNDYAVGAYVLGSDSVMYKSLLVSGPSTAPQDPISNPTYWAPLAGGMASNAQAIAGAAANLALTPANITGVFSAAGRRNMAATGSQRIPGGSSPDLILNWSYGVITGPGTADITWHTPFTTQVFTIQCTVDQPTTVPAYVVTAGNLAGCGIDLNQGSEGSGVYVFAIGY